MSSPWALFLLGFTLTCALGALFFASSAQLSRDPEIAGPERGSEDLRVTSSRNRRSINTTTTTTSGPSKPKSESDFSTHPNFHLLPSLDECGFRYHSESKFNKVSSVSQSQNGTTITIEDDSLVRRKRVIGGVPAEFGKNPWMVGIIQKNLTTNDIYPICGGTIINNHTILTAAHCVTDVNAGAAITHILLGAYRVSVFDARSVYVREMPMEVCTSDETGAWVCSRMHLAEIEEVVVHENFSTGAWVDDMALVKIRDSIWSFNTSFHCDALDDNYLNAVQNQGSEKDLQLIRPICLPRRKDFLQGTVHKKFELVGWGYLSRYPAIIRSPILNRVELQRMPNEYCTDVQGLETEKDQLCVMGQPGTGTCPGDSGSPLLKVVPVAELGGKDQVFQVGIDSNSFQGKFDCGSQGMPTWFTNVIELMPWILDNLS